MYTLSRKLTNGGFFIYTVKDASGKVLATRKSQREYVAATINGSNYFGRVDLAMKAQRNGLDTPIAYMEFINKLKSTQEPPTMGMAY